MGHFIIPGRANSGVILCQPVHDVPEDSTLIIEGLARGGTSMVSAMADSAGYFMDGCAPAWESNAWKHCIKYGGDVDEMIAKYNAEHERWGFKHPGLMWSWQTKWEEFLGKLRNPRVLIISRDVVAVNIRSYLAMRNHSIEVAAAQMAQLVNWSIGTGIPTALVSYEKMLQATNDTKYHVNKFLGGEVDWNLVVPNNPQYISMMGTARTV